MIEDTTLPDFLEKLKGVVPKPSKYNPHKLIDEVATSFSKTYRELASEDGASPFKVKKLLDLMKINLNIEAIDEPENCFFFASYFEDEGTKQMTVNEKHLDFFRKNPMVFRQTVGHEIGHSALKHFECYEQDGAPNLFLNPKLEPPVFHNSVWAHYTLTKEEVEQLKRLNKRAQQVLVKRAVINDDAREALNALNNKFEPEWMFWQAEYFGLCLLIPSDLILKELENPWDLTSWSNICKLAEIFSVKPSMMKTRLKKMRLIDVDDDGKISLVFKEEQMSLF